MPNWVMNTLSISGDVEKVKKIKDTMGAPYKEIDNGAVNFLNLIAPPDEAWSAYANPEEQMLSQEAKQANPYNWYDWNSGNWGVKWNASGGWSNEMTENNGEGFWQVGFETPWGPPIPVIEALVKFCEELGGIHFTYHWIEEQGFGEEYEYGPETGIEMIRDWDTPSSHADNVEQDRSCVRDWDDNQEYWYDDCPRTEESQVAELATDGVK